MLKRIFKIFILFPLSLYFIFFAIYNHQSVEIVFLPFLTEEKAYSFALPFYVSIYTTLMIGVIFGGLAAWLRQSRYRSQVRMGAKDARYWRLEAERLTRERDQKVLTDSGNFLKIRHKTIA